MSLNSLIRWLKPREMVFFELLEASAGNLHEAVKFFTEELEKNDPERWVVLRRNLKDFEHRGDQITHDIIDRLDQFFVTPIEREDILDLAHALDDVVDCMYAVTERLVLFKIPSVLPSAQEMSRILLTGSTELIPLIHSLRTMNDIKRIREMIHELNAMENRADAVYHTALAELFDDPKDPIYLMKWREILGLIEDATDRLELVAKVVGSTVMRNA